MQRWTTVVVLILALGGCERRGKSDRRVPPVPAPPAPPARWVRALPPGPVSAAPADIVWATIPRAGSERIERFGRARVLAVTGNTATLGGRMFRQYPGVPAALIHRAPAIAGVKRGDVVTTSIADRPHLAVVRAAAKGRVLLRYRWSGRTVELWTRYAFKPLARVAPLAWIRSPASGGDGAAGATVRGFVVATDDKRAWVLEPNGEVVIRKRAGVQPFPLAATYRPGQKVMVCAPACVPGVVEKVLEPDFRYRVRLGQARTASRRDCLFSDLSRSR